MADDNSQSNSNFNAKRTVNVIRRTRPLTVKQAIESNIAKITRNVNKGPVKSNGPE